MRNYLVVDGLNIFWQPSAPRRIHLATNDPTFTDENGERPGIRMVVSCNPKSADYNPAMFNRCARALAAAGLPAPEEVPLHDRHLTKRNKVIRELSS